MVRRAASECTVEQRAGNRSPISREAGAWATCSDLRALSSDLIPLRLIWTAAYTLNRRTHSPGGRVERWGIFDHTVDPQVIICIN